MSETEIIMLFTIIGIILGVFITMLAIFHLLKKKGVDISGILEETQKVIDTSDTVLDAKSKDIFENEDIEILKIIDRWAKIAVGSAEQLFHAGNIDRDERSELAENVVFNVLKELNINIDDNKKAIIDAAIKNAVNNLGHSKAPDTRVNNTNI
ncbi:phage holin, LLH family [Clostridium felsineum]|uniref:Uncharacterized protein n=1 Tax=Clostridium felsineum TaxID=36839 RepID=A0A1S8LBD7_9CLOT|nr:phage holin, LLH family [Clostridium felsineum]URZ06950.1 hypothetical protein CLROS_022830 [Clostridium felsineum]URZ11982.1 hypothetical protein CROST_026990 [Clostridium felsineum]